MRKPLHPEIDQFPLLQHANDPEALSSTETDLVLLLRFDFKQNNPQNPTTRSSPALHNEGLERLT